MKKKIENLFSLPFHLIFIYLLCNEALSNEIEPYIEPETNSVVIHDKYKKKTSRSQILVTANDYATKVGLEILESGGNVADATVAIQLTLGLVEPQSSGIGGGTFITYYDSQSGQTYSYDGREKAPEKINEAIFINDDGSKKKFYDAAIGGLAVGVPGTLDVLFRFQKKFGSLEWRSVIEPVVKLSEDGFYPPKRLINALKKDKFINIQNKNTIFSTIINHPNRKIFNKDYTKTLKSISKNYRNFYEGDIAKKIVNRVQKLKKNNSLSLLDLKKYASESKPALCAVLPNKNKICGPHLPSSGTICIIQVLKLADYIFQKKKYLNYEDILEIFDFVYYFRDKKLADTSFVNIDIEKILDLSFLVKNFEKFESKKTSFLIEEVLNSTSHFSLVDRFNNVVSVTSSIESSFGSRLLVDGFFLNNQLTDFSFSIKDDDNTLIKNRVEGGKKPLSSMSPLIIFDENNDFLMSIGSPGGKAIISYVSRVLIEYFYKNKSLSESINSPNYIRINGKSFIESQKLKAEIIGNTKVRSLTSGLGIIEKKDDLYFGFADSRRDGTVRGN